MRTTFDITDILYEAIKAHGFTISGGVYKFVRPVNSNKVDIVVGSLPVNGEQIQTAVANINIFAPNLQLVINGVQDNSQPDWNTLKNVTELVVGFLKEKIGNDYWFRFQQQNFFADPEAKSYYSNIRVKFYSENF